MKDKKNKKQKDEEYAHNDHSQADLVVDAETGGIPLKNDADLENASPTRKTSA